jgi:hypothetical protein
MTHLYPCDYRGKTRLWVAFGKYKFKPYPDISLTPANLFQWVTNMYGDLDIIKAIERPSGPDEFTAMRFVRCNDNNTATLMARLSPKKDSLDQYTVFIAAGNKDEKKAELLEERISGVLADCGDVEKIEYDRNSKSVKIFCGVLYCVHSILDQEHNDEIRRQS